MATGPHLVQLEQRVKRLREKYDAQIRDVERSEQVALSKFNECRQTIADLTSELSALKGAHAHTVRELDDVRAVATRLSQERENVTDIVRQEFEQALATAQHDSETLRKTLSDDHATHRAAVAALQAAKDQELDALHQRVQGAIAMKDDTIAMLRQQFEAAAVRADHLEQVCFDWFLR